MIPFPCSAGLTVYVAPTLILPADLLEGAARGAVIIFARGVSAASLAATVAMASIKVRRNLGYLSLPFACALADLGVMLRGSFPFP